MKYNSPCFWRRQLDAFIPLEERRAKVSAGACRAKAGAIARIAPVAVALVLSAVMTLFGVAPALADDATHFDNPSGEVSTRAVKQKSSEYMLEGSDKSVVTTNQLASLSVKELFIARNELFARHGAAFDNDILAKHFNSCSWYSKISPKLKTFGTEILNPIERTNADTIRGMELSRNSPYVNPLDDNRRAMYRSYRSIVRDRQDEYGACGLVPCAKSDSLAGTCLVQLVDMDKDGWEELLIVYHDADGVAEERRFAGQTYTVELWSCEDGEPELVYKDHPSETNSGSAYLIITDTGTRYELSSAGYDLHNMPFYYYRLSSSPGGPAAGDGYWLSYAHISLSVYDAKTITEETIRTLAV